MLNYQKIIFLAIVTLLSTALIVFINAVYVDKYKDLKNQWLAKRVIINPVRVFQIGFSKCGTTTIAEFFKANGVPAVHQDHGYLPKDIYENYRNSLALIPSRYEKYLVFTDMEFMGQLPQINIGVLLFKELDKQYPGSKFILNTRNKQAWLKSRSLHRMAGKKSTLLEFTADLLKISPAEVLVRWSQEWDMHHLEAIRYFKDRPNDLLVFDIERDNPQKLVSFFKNNYILDSKRYSHKNKTISNAGIANDQTSH